MQFNYVTSSIFHTVIDYRLSSAHLLQHRSIIVGSCFKPSVHSNITLIFRYNGFLPQGDRGRRRSKFVLYKRTEPNGVKRSKHYIVQSPQTSKAILDTTQHSISYTLSRNQAVIVEYKEDSDTDMFQVSRIVI